MGLSQHLEDCFWGFDFLPVLAVFLLKGLVFRVLINTHLRLRLQGLVFQALRILVLGLVVVFRVRCFKYLGFIHGCRNSLQRGFEGLRAEGWSAAASSTLPSFVSLRPFLSPAL